MNRDSKGRFCKSLDDLVHSNYDRTPEELLFSAKVCAWCIVLGIITLLVALVIG